MLDSRVLEAPLLDHRAVNLDSAGHVTYVLEQSFRYEYDAPVSSLRHRLVVVPPRRHGNQYRRAHRLEVTVPRPNGACAGTLAATSSPCSAPNTWRSPPSSGSPPSSSASGTTGQPSFRRRP